MDISSDDIPFGWDWNTSFSYKTKVTDLANDILHRGDKGRYNRKCISIKYRGLVFGVKMEKNNL